MTSTQFVTAFYTTVFGRPADAGGLQFWSAALDALGGATEPSAQAALMGRLIDIASTPVTVRPSGISDAEYAQTVADRARFLNKAEVGVYFAAEVRSNDLSLAKQVLAGVTADSSSVGTARTFADQAINPTPPVVVPPIVVPALTSADDVATITSKLAVYAGAAATADTSGMDATQLKAVAASLAKFKADGLTGTLALTNVVTAGEAGALLSKYAGSTATVDASLFTGTQLQVLSGSLAKLATITQPTLTLADAWLTSSMLNAFLLKSSDAQLDTTLATSDHLTAVFSRLARLADNGIVGTLSVPSVVPATTLGTLFQKTAIGATVSVNASFMDVDQVVVLFQQAEKIDSISNLSVPAGTMARLPSDIGTLFQKGTGIKVDLTGASFEQIQGVAAYVLHYADDGLTGTYSVDYRLLPAQIDALLGARASTAANVEVPAFGMTAEQLISVVQGITKVDTLRGLSLNTNVSASLTDLQFETLLSKTTNASVNVTSIGAAKTAKVMAQLDHIGAGGLSFKLSIDVTQLQAATVAKLDVKLSSSSTLSVTGNSTGDVIDLTGLNKASYIAAGEGADSITLGAGEDTVFIRGVGDTRSTSFSTSDTTTQNIGKIYGLQTTDVLKFSTASGAFVADASFGPGTIRSTFSQSVAGTGVTTIQHLYDKLNELFGQEALGSSANKMEVAMLTISDGGSFAGKTFIAFNDGTAQFNEQDAIVEVTASGGAFPRFEYGL